MLNVNLVGIIVLRKSLVHSARETVFKYDCNVESKESLSLEIIKIKEMGRNIEIGNDFILMEECLKM